MTRWRGVRKTLPDMIRKNHEIAPHLAPLWSVRKTSVSRTSGYRCGTALSTTVATFEDASTSSFLAFFQLSESISPPLPVGRSSVQGLGRLTRCHHVSAITE